MAISYYCNYGPEKCANCEMPGCECVHHRLQPKSSTLEHKPSTLERIETLLADMNARMERMENWIRDMKGETK